MEKKTDANGVKGAVFYDHQSTENKWRRVWEETKVNQTDILGADKPFFNLMMFPYPSAEGLHVGNMYAFSVADIYGRFKRMKGYDVFEPIGLDGFGIHSENYALKVGRHPQEHARITQENFYNQLHKIGAMYDWSKTVETYNPNYYRWTQWLFVQMFKAGLAYRSKSLVNWCPKCKTVLSDEQVISGKCERCSSVVEKRELEQWSFKITAYAQKLLDNLAVIDWTERIKNIQRNWIGRSEGAEIDFKMTNPGAEGLEKIRVFTTRPDTLQGVTFLALAPNYPGLLEVVSKEKVKEIRAFVKNHTNQPEGEKDKVGTPTGLSVINPVTNKSVPVWVANYVDVEYGTGAIMGVPAHDERDREFATKYQIDIVEMLPDEDMWGRLESEKWGEKTVKFHLRDWLISRQRYWGPPIPMIYCANCASGGKSWFNTQGRDVKLLSGDKSRLAEQMAGWYPVEESDLPVLLPIIDDYTPDGTGKGPLANHQEFYEVECPGCGLVAKRETDVSDTFLDSAWYFLRYPTVGLPKQDEVPWDKEVTGKWLPVPMYTGGAEHATLHLMYTRFITMALKDMGHLGFEEPFSRFFAHGMIIKEGAKMSKSKGNVVVPDEYIEKYGADAVRLYLMFMGPAEAGGDFRDTGMEGMYRWVKRLWRTFVEQEKRFGSGEAEVDSALAKLVIKAERDFENRHYNTVISGLMELMNLVETKQAVMSREQWGVLVRILAPIAPFISEEIWSRLKIDDSSVHTQSWPEMSGEVIMAGESVVAIQVNGKTKAKVSLQGAEALDETKVKEAALALDKVSSSVSGDNYKLVFVPGRIINFVTK